MTLRQTLLLILLAAIWGSSFIFMRATAEVFGPIALIAVRSIVAALCLFGFLLNKRRWKEFKENWRTLAWVGIISSSLPFSFLAYASLHLNAGMVAILNAMTPIITVIIATLWLKDKMTKLQFLGLTLSFTGLIVLISNKVSWSIESWWPILAGVTATFLYGLATNSTKKYLSQVSTMTSTAGTLFFAALFMSVLFPFFLPDFSKITGVDWLYAITLGIVCTAFAYMVLFKLVHEIGPAKISSVTFLVPIFSFLWAYLLLDEVVTTRMLIATAIILSGMILVLGLVKFKKTTV